MASSADRMAAGAGFGALAKADELKKRLWFTVGALIIYRLGTYLPLPGIDPGALADIFSQQSGGILGMFDMFSGGALSRMTIFALNIMPYITASIIMQLMTAIVPTLEAMKKRWRGRSQDDQSIYPLPYRAVGNGSGLRYCGGSRGGQRCC
jgi:preprotein translocase subunit SecY